MFEYKTKAQLVAGAEPATEATLSTSERAAQFITQHNLQSSKWSQASIWVITPIVFFLTFCAVNSYMHCTLTLWYIGRPPLFTHMAIISICVAFLLLCSTYSFFTGWNRYNNAPKELLVFICAFAALTPFSHVDPLFLLTQIQTYFELPMAFLVAALFRKVGRFASDRASDITRKIVNQTAVVTGLTMFLTELALGQHYRPIEVHLAELIALVTVPSLLALCRLPCRDLRTGAHFALLLQSPLIAAIGLNILTVTFWALMFGASDAGYLRLAHEVQLVGEQGLAVKIFLLLVLSCPVILGPVLASAIAVHLNRQRFSRLSSRNA